MSSEEKGGQKKLKRDARRESILRGAAKAFVKNGYEATSLDDIAEAAGVSRALIYRHFVTKRDIYVTLLRGDTPTMGTLNENAGRIDHLIEVAMTEPDRFRLLFRHAAREPEFREIMSKRQQDRVSFAEESLKPFIDNPKQRRFLAVLVSDTVIGILLSWADAGCLYPDKMPVVIQKAMSAIVDSFAA